MHLKRTGGDAWRPRAQKSGEHQMRKVQSTAWECSGLGGGALADVRTGEDDATGNWTAWRFGSALIELVVDTTTCETGDGLAGNTWQQLGDFAEAVIAALCATADFAIIGQRGRQCSRLFGLPLQQ
jgi:hypothetical protein